MSKLILCDGDDCYQSENEVQMFSIDDKTREFLQTYCSNWTKYHCEDICQDCIDQANNDYENFFIIKDYLLNIGQEYIDNPKLID